jgi:pilus assembly protein CpaD
MMAHTIVRKMINFCQPLGLILCLLGTLEACTNSTGSPDGADYRNTHPLKVERKTISMVVPPVRVGHGLAADARSHVTRFAGDFLRRARSPLTISMAGDGGAVEAVRKALMVEGVDPRSIVLKGGGALDDGKPGTLILSFDAYAIEVPECGDWSGANGAVSTNLPHTNFGCSYQRNIGLMISDPGDLVVPRAPGAIDPRHSDRAIGLYRTGKPTISEQPTNEGGRSSSVGGS